MALLLFQCVSNKSESIIPELFSQLPRDSLYFVHDSQRIAAPEFFDLIFSVTAADEFQGR